jgi:beta-phosphoglucomutase-like phosphatase (HAD superfamily)
VETIAALMLEPVGCLAEFRPDEFDQAARELFGATAETSESGSQAYWRLVGMMGQRAPAEPGAFPGKADSGFPTENATTFDSDARLEALELAAVEQCDLYEDVRPSLEKLRASEVGLYLVSSLSRRALARFVVRFDLAGLLSGSVSRDDAQGVAAAPLHRAFDQANLAPGRCIYLADTAFSLDVAKQSGVNGLLMINDYDEGRALAECNPMGGVVSLAELSDALQLIEQRAGLRGAGRLPHRPHELFEP